VAQGEGRTEAENLGPSTTDTTFLYSGGPRPTETMQMVGEVASDRDREWFERHPQAGYRVRWSLPGEVPHRRPPDDHGPAVRPGGRRWAVVVLQRTPGVRQRVPLQFVDGGPQTESIRPEAWPEFHRAAQAPDRQVAVQELAARLLGKDAGAAG
jgi:hypothetical protein